MNRGRTGRTWQTTVDRFPAVHQDGHQFGGLGHDQETTVPQCLMQDCSTYRVGLLSEHSGLAELVLKMKRAPPDAVS